jgi:cytochrome P450
MALAFRRDLPGALLQGFRQHGELVAYRFGPSGTPLQWVMVGAYGPDSVRQVLTGTERDFGRQTAGIGALTEVFGRGLFTTEGEAWRGQRRTLQPMFTPQRVAGYHDMVAEEADRVVASVPAGVVDLHELMLRYTLRVLGRALFGGAVDGIAPRLHRLVPLLSDAGFRRGSQVVRPPLRWPTPGNRRLVRLRAQLHELVDQLLDRAGTDQDFVSRLRAADNPETGQPFSVQEIRDQVLLFLIAGHETTATAATFTLDLLGRSPAEQDQVATEPDPVLARAALLEGMRLFPPAYLYMRVARTDVEIAGHLVPRGTHVFVSPWVTHRHPEFWPDPERFDPHRFIGDQDRPRYAYFPFGGGPRSCIGEQLALVETTVLVRALLARYRIEAAAAPPRISTRLTLRPAGPVLANLVPRRGGGAKLRPMWTVAGSRVTATGEFRGSRRSA